MISNFLQRDPASLNSYPVEPTAGASDKYHRRFMVAADDIPRGSVVMRERPLLAVSNLVILNESTGPGASALYEWECPLRITDEQCLEGIKNAPGHFAAIYDDLLCRRPDLLTTDTAWMDEFCCDSPTKDNSAHVKAVEALCRKKLARKFNKKKAAKYLCHSMRFWGLCQTNEFKAQSPLGHTEHGTALYRWASYLNHSCVPNAMYYMGRDMDIVVRAAVDIKAGEEITISYASPPSSVYTRTPALTSALLFKCQCGACRPSGVREILYDGPNERALSQVHLTLSETALDPARHSESIVALDVLCAMHNELVLFLTVNADMAVNFCDLASAVLERDCIVVGARNAVVKRASALYQILSLVCKGIKESGHDTLDKYIVVMMHAMWFQLLAAAQTFTAYNAAMNTVLSRMTEEEHCSAVAINDARLGKIIELFAMLEPLVDTAYCCGKDRKAVGDIIEQALVYADIDPVLRSALREFAAK